MNAAAYRVAVTAALMAMGLPVLAACGPSSSGGGDAAPPSPPGTGSGTASASAQAPGRETASASPTGPASVPPPPSTPPPSAPAAADGSDIRACYDGSCEISVAEPTTVPVDGRRFGFTAINVTRISADDVTIESRASDGTYLRSGVSPGGTAALNGLAVRVKSVTGHTAVLVLSSTN